ncbi:MAG: HDOD domain-containing protein [Pseudomonadota bacterium]
MLPPLPEAARDILTTFDDEFVTGNQVAEIVGRDPSITARLVALANSAFFGRGKPVTDMTEIVNRVLGVDSVRSLALALAAAHVLDTTRCPGFDSGRFWVNALMMADCTRRAVGKDKHADPDDQALAYQTGLCHNLGLLAMVYLQPGPVSEVLRWRESTEDETLRLGPALIGALGMDHRQVTSAVAEMWDLPAGMKVAYEDSAGPGATTVLGDALEVARRVVGAGPPADDEESAPEDSEGISISARQWARAESMVNAIS